MTETAKDESAVFTKLKRASQAANAKKRWEGVEAADRKEQMREVARQRWTLHEATEEEARQFFDTEDLDTATEAYQRLRRVYELAGKILDTRLQQQDEQKCANCGVLLDETRPWYNREAKRDPQTGRIYNEFSCSQACMIALKGKRQASGMMRA